MSLLEDRINKIIELRQLGFNDNKIAEELGLSDNLIRNYEESTRKVIVNSISIGYRKLEDIARHVQLSPILVDIFMSQYNIKIPETKPPKDEKSLKSRQINIPSIEIGKRYHKNRETRKKEIEQEITKGASSIQEVAERLNLKPRTILQYERMGYIKLPKYWVRKIIQPVKERPEIDQLVKQGLKLREIGEAMGGVSRERARQYIHGRGLYKMWKIAQQVAQQEVKKAKLMEREEYRATMSQLAYILKERVKQLAHENKWAYEKASEYQKQLKKRNKRTNIPLETLIKLFERYKGLKDSGIKASLEELTRDLDMAITSAGRILKAVGEEPLYGRRLNVKRTTEEEKEAIRRGTMLRMSDIDIGYFLDTPQYIVSANRRKTKKKPIFKPYIAIFSEGFASGATPLTYRLTSQIYEAQDMGFKEEEIAELLNTKKQIVKYALKHRRLISPKIMYALKILYPSKEITKPYKN